MTRLSYIANIRLPTEKAHGIQIMKMCATFANQGLQVELVVPTRRNPLLGDKDPFVYYGVAKNFQIRYLSTPDPYWLIGWPGGIYIKLQSWFFARALAIFCQKLRSRAETTVYIRDEYFLNLAQQFFPRVFWEAHNLPRHPARYLKIWQKCSGIVAISHGLKTELVNLGIGRDKIFVAADGVDVNQFIRHGGQKSPPEADPPLAEKLKLRAELGLPQDKRIVMYTGHLYEWKGAGTLAQAAKFFPPEVSAVFVGGTVYDQKKFAAAYGHLKNILLVAHQPPTTIPKYLQAADVLVVPNTAKSAISRSYTSPLKLFEYMAAGQPIVASAIPSIQEILNSTNAVLVQADDPAALAAGVNQLLADPQRSIRLAAQARADIEKYDWQERAHQILKFIGV